MCYDFWQVVRPERPSKRRLNAFKIALGVEIPIHLVNLMSDFTHYGPFEGTETEATAIHGITNAMISLTMARLRVLKLEADAAVIDQTEISLTMARLRVLKLVMDRPLSRDKSFHSLWPV